MKTATASALVALALTLTVSPASPARAHNGASEISALSLLPVAVSVAAPVGLLSAGVGFTVVAVSAAAEGTVWILERASDGARMSVTVSARAAQGASVTVGAALTTSAIATGWVLSAMGKAVCFIPNEIGKALLHNERVTR